MKKEIEIQIRVTPNFDNNAAMVEVQDADTRKTYTDFLEKKEDPSDLAEAARDLINKCLLGTKLAALLREELKSSLVDGLGLEYHKKREFCEGMEATNC